MQLTAKDPTAQLIDELDEVIANFKKRMAEQPMPCGSRALAFAMQAGLPPRMTYNVSDTAKYLGVDVKTLREEHKAGRLAFIIPVGQERGARIKVDEVDRWLAEN
ncbi:Helix-turn-helix domain protein [Collinsella intestinalis]|uniref:Helix-turn-helix domain protein n=1 Tax=Collinsella intestinalis TaxID=147207 RepID=A0A5K1IT34_9ACTN|nr:helix-turn-helix domain-containing protein [Collinsella intestinalis]VWL91552.1 Helix-turn-helix domain protein [Collinsella intestinalis]